MNVKNFIENLTAEVGRYVINRIFFKDQNTTREKMKINPSFLATATNDPRSFCERTVIEDFLRLCDIPGTSPQWCIDEIQRNLESECGDRYSCLITDNDSATVASLHDYRDRTEK